MSRNDELFARAQRTIPAGVNSPVRAFRSVGGTPRFLTRGEGPYVWDADGKRYIDYVGSWGPAILGHAHPHVVRAVQESAVHGLSFGAPTETEIVMAETLCRRLPSLELVRPCRRAPGNDVGVAPRLWLHWPRQDLAELPRPRRQPAVKADGRVTTISRRGWRAAGIAQLTIVVPYKTRQRSLRPSRRRRMDCGVIVEPRPPTESDHAERGFEGLALCDSRRGPDFRRGDDGICACAGVQGLTGPPDLTMLGKVIGACRYSAASAIMEKIAPLGPCIRQERCRAIRWWRRAHTCRHGSPGFYED